MAASVSHFVVPAFEQTIQLGVVGSILSEPIPVIDVSAVAVIEVSTEMMRSVFQFQTDATDLNNLSDSDIKYYVDTAAWDGIELVNPANAMLNHTESLGTITAQDPTGAPLPTNKQFVAHDFVRYLSLRLFNTPYGVDLFQNEEDLMADIRAKCSADDTLGSVWKNIKAKLELVNKENAEFDSASGKCMTNGNTTADNICRVLMLQMLSTQIQRFQDITLANAAHSGEVGICQGLPFMDGDSISFKLSINPAEGQEETTGVEAFSGRSYEIRLAIRDAPENTEPADDEANAP